jgi:hypothetical protein
MRSRGLTSTETAASRCADVRGTSPAGRPANSVFSVATRGSSEPESNGRLSASVVMVECGASCHYTVAMMERTVERETPPASSTPRRGTDGNAPAWWGIFGVAAVFAFAVYRLGGRGIATLQGGLTPLEWLALAGLTTIFVYGEGVRALQRRYNPYVVRRVEVLRAEPRLWYRLLAPLHAISLIGAPPGILVRAWGGSAAIMVAVVVVSRFPEPWRGITDLAVASALAWGTVTLVAQAWRTLRK